MYVTAKRGEQERLNALKLQKEAALSAAEAWKQELKLSIMKSKNASCKWKQQMKSLLMVTRDLSVALDSSKKTVEKKVIEAAQSKIEIGLGQKRQLEERLEKLKFKKAKKAKKWTLDVIWIYRLFSLTLLCCVFMLFLFVCSLLLYDYMMNLSKNMFFTGSLFPWTVLKRA